MRKKSFNQIRKASFKKRDDDLPSESEDELPEDMM